ncbi:MAG: Fur family zinc uptake transcriptional regulator [Paracoccaceae bacterium]|jgi:Fur family zinc uptake transcriptional regulator
MPSKPPPQDPVSAFARHDHGRCRAAAMAAAASICAERGLRLTKARSCALEILLQSHKALGAYEVLDGMSAAGLGAQPPVAYRALDFLVTNGLAHRIEKLNAYVACARPDHVHAPAFLICRLCRQVAEADAPRAQAGLGVAAERLGFAIEVRVVELEGLCPACRPAEGA